MMPDSRPLAVCTAALCVASCVATTTFTSTWKAPDVQAVNAAGKSVAAVFISREESERRAAEDVMAADLNSRGVHGVAAYTILPAERSRDAEAARARLKEAGADAVVVMRVVGRDQRITYAPGYPFPQYYDGFGPYWGYGWRVAYDPGYLRSDTIVSVETLIYSLQRDKLLWASASRTSNPKDLGSLVNEVADATAREMVKEGLLLPSSK
jgi:hypothetical protein